MFGQHLVGGALGYPAGGQFGEKSGHAVDLNKKSPVVCKQEKVHAFMGVNMSAL